MLCTYPKLFPNQPRNQFIYRRVMVSLLGLQATAEYFGYSTNWVMAQIRSKGLPAYRVGNSWRFIPADLETWVRKQPHTIRRVSSKQGFKAVSSKALRRGKQKVNR